jgi:2-methylcitrate dehydratase PrpD
LKEKKALAREWADFIVRTEFEDLPADVVHFTKRFMLDQLGCTLVGKNYESSDIVVDVVKELGGEPQSTVIGYGIKTSCANAAFANSIVAYAAELNHEHRQGTQHPVVVVAPAAMALGEREHAGGKEVLTALALGTELMIRVGESFLGFAYNAGFHPTGIVGPFGAAAAAGKIIGLNEQQMVDALGIAGSASAGLGGVTVASGAWTKRFQGGHPAMCGVIAALLGEKGFKGPAYVFEGVDEDGGMVKAFSYNNTFDLSMINSELGKRWELLKTSVKIYACCAFLIPVIDCTIELANKYNIKPEDVEEATVKVCERFAFMLMEPKERKYHPQDTVDAQFSIPYGVGLGICRKAALTAEFSGDTLKDPKILEVAAKVRTEEDPEATRRFPKDHIATVVIKTKDGKEYSVRREHAKGQAENPATDEDLEVKFRTITKGILSDKKASEVIETVWKLDELDDINYLTDMVRG